ncbi:hypothetical protein [[Mycobacterium] wendilense]|uniref:Transmembrane protein n=1 Tax=[Mycobacterium] wendilense TaxID=3064284 RepID=A0ABN9P7J5_9MYCO|nr:hypothetical protein [Mycolicibacterium sp. MU0050]CAJ1585821.1 hypothetical protein MU0050_003934 [Mycolicibacterium sp. MU0050]
MGGALTTRRLLAMIAAGLVLLIGVLTMWQPVYLSEFDNYGLQISCGSGFFADLSHAEIVDGGPGPSTDACQSALLIRRVWAIPTMVLGAAVLLTLALRGTRVVSPQSRN